MCSDFLKKLVSFRDFNLIFTLDVMLVPDIVEILIDIIFVLSAFKSSPLFDDFTGSDLRLSFGDDFGALLAILLILFKHGINKLVVFGSMLFSITEPLCSSS